MSARPTTSGDLGPFRVLRKVAEGGFGEIWRGTHLPSGLDVAIKVLTRAHARDPAFYATFRSEVQAVARLDHPGVVTVFDFGTVGDSGADAGAGPLLDGSPYLVMELAEHGSLDRRLGQLDGPSTIAVLAHVLRALAHTHAHSVVHLDLKPGNILVFEDGPAEALSLKLTDFGLAHTVSALGGEVDRPMHPSTSDAETVLGTPAYMAPEQVEARVAELGPWTDLYALGVMAWELLTGALPFHHDDPVTLAVKQLRDPLPDFRPRFDLPDALEDWVRRLLRKPPTRRYRCAADALHALSRICGDADLFAKPGTPRLVHTESASAPTRVLGTGEAVERAAPSPQPPTAASLHPELPPTLVTPSRDLVPGERRPESASESVHWEFGADVPPFPEDWRDAVGEVPVPRLVGAGLGLYGLRAVPLVGREAERDLLWRTLHRVRNEGAAAAVVLHGPSGYGKSRLAEWLAVTASECGAARALFVAHDAAAGPRRGVQTLVASRFGIGTGDFDAALARVREVLGGDGVLDEYEARAVAEIVATGGAGGAEPGRVRFASNFERFSAAARVLARAARERPLVVWVDDAQWGADTLAFIRHTLATDGARAMPVLFVVTAQTEALAERAIERELLEGIDHLSAARRVDVGAIPTDAFVDLVGELLLLDATLARQVSRRAAGNPLYAIQLVGDWVERGVLRQADGGFRLADGATVELPDDLFALWDRRIERVLRGATSDDIDGLGLAAVLGHEVDAHEYRVALDLAGLRTPARLIESLAAHGLVAWSTTGWRFGHSMFRETIIRRARGPERWHGTAADALAIVHRGSSAATERIARHLVAAGRDDEALAPLLESVEQHVALGEYGEAHALLDTWEGALERLHAPSEDAVRVGGTLARAEVYRRQWKLDGARQAASRAIRIARRAGAYRSRAEALSILGHIARQERDFELAERHTFEALGIFESMDDFLGKARAVRAVAVTAREQGQLDRAVDCYEKAMNLFWTLDEEGEVADCLYGLGHVHRTRRNYAKAQAHYHEAREIAERIGNPHQLAEFTNGLAEVARYSGRLDEAEAMYREAMTTMRRVGSRDAIIPRLNLALTLILRRDFAGARHELLSSLPDIDNPAFRAWTLVHLLPCYAHLGEMDLFDATLSRAREAIRDTAMVDTDIAEAAELCADILRIRDEPARAREVLIVAASQWGAMDNAAKRDEVLARVGRL